MNKVIRRVYLTWNQPCRWIEVIFSVDVTDFSSINGLLRVVKGAEERGEPHDDLIRHFGKSAFSMIKVIRRVYLTWKHPRRWIDVIFPLN